MTTIEARRRGLRRGIPRVRGTAIAIALPVIAFLVLAGYWVFHTRADVVGTNTIGPRFVLPGFAPSQRLCARGVDLPGNANTLQLDIGAPAGRSPRATLRLSAGGRTQVAHGLLFPGVVGASNFHFQPIGHDTLASWCLRAASPTIGEAGTLAPTAYTGAAFVDGHAIGQLSQTFLHVPARRQIAALPAGARHAATLRAGFVGAWTYWLLAAVVLIACVAGLRLVLRGMR